MADVDIDPFRGDDRTESRPNENIPLTPLGEGSTWEPEHDHETSFGGESQRASLTKDYVKDLCKKLSEKIGGIPEPFHYDYFKLEGGELYYIGNRKPLTTEGKLKSVGMLADILGKNRLRRLGFNMPVGKVAAQQAVMLNEAAEELPFTSDIDKVDDIELQEIAKSREDLISQLTQTDDLFEYPLRDLLSLDKQLRTIRGSLRLKWQRRFSWKNTSRKSIATLREFENILGNMTIS